MTTYFTSDTHFFHNNIITFCNRPFGDVDKMNREMVKAWNSRVQPDDTIYHLGDVAFSGMTKTGPLLEQLNGKKILVRGNHDPSKLCEWTGWAEVHDRMIAYQLPGVGEVWLCHYPRGDDRYGERAPPEDGLPVVCGHVHRLWGEKEDHINVGVDVRNFLPVSEKELADLFHAQSCYARQR